MMNIGCHGRYFYGQRWQNETVNVMEWKISEKNEKCGVLYPWNVNFGGFGGYIKNIQCGDGVC